MLFFGFFFLLRSSVSNGIPYCYSSVSFSLSLRSSVSTEDLHVILRVFFLVYCFFFLLDFSETPERIFMKFSGMVYIGLKRPKIIFRVMTSLPVRGIKDFLIFRVSFCSEIFSKTTQGIFFKFSQMIDKWLKSVPFEFQVSSSKSAEAR